MTPEKEFLIKLLEIKGILDQYVILKEDEKGRYIEYAFKEGAPKDNRCLSWYDKPHPNARVRNGYKSNYPVREINKIYTLGLFSCGDQDKEGDEHCSAGHPKKRCLLEGCAKHWTYEEPIKCACWFLHESGVTCIDDIPLFGMSISELEKRLINQEVSIRYDENNI